MIFDADYDGINPVAGRLREPLEYRHDFVKMMKMVKKTMLPKLTQEHSGDVQRYLGMLWNDPRCSWIVFADF